MADEFTGKMLKGGAAYGVHVIGMWCLVLESVRWIGQIESVR